MTRQTDTWGIAVAKARLSEVIERAQVDGPQLISRNGRSVAVVVSFDEWERKTKRQGTLAEFFAVSPLPQSGIDLERITGWSARDRPVSFLLDTNVISEWAKPQLEPNVVTWLTEVDEDRIWLSVISFAEIRRGIELMPAGRQRTRLAAWLADDLSSRFEGRILPIDSRVAEFWGVMMARGQRAGMPIGALDAFIAATAKVHALTLVTRNTDAFQSLSIPLLNPWRLK